MLEHLLDLRHHRLQRRARAEHRDVRLGGANRASDAGTDLHAKRAALAEQLTDVSPDLRRIDVNGANELESIASHDLLRDRHADRPKTDVQHTNAHQH